MKTKVIIIFWRWKLRGTDMPCFFETSDQKAVLHCVHQEAKESEWKPYLLEIVNTNPRAEYLLFLHLDDKFSASTRSNIKSYLARLLTNKDLKLLYHPFFGGKEFVYFNRTRDTGLLWNGTLVKNQAFTDTNLVHSVFDPGDDTKILNHYFDPVWDHYNNYKRNFFEIHEHIIRHFAIIKELPSESLKNYAEFNQHYSLARSLERILDYNDVKETTLALDLGENQELILSEYGSLLDHFEQNLDSPEYFTHLNQKFTKVINLLPGNIY